MTRIKRVTRITRLARITSVTRGQRMTSIVRLTGRDNLEVKNVKDGRM